MKHLIKARRYQGLLLISTSLFSACGGSGQLVIGQKNSKTRQPSDVREIDPQVNPQEFRTTETWLANYARAVAAGLGYDLDLCALSIDCKPGLLNTKALEYFLDNIVTDLFLQQIDQLSV